jgi:flagellar basal-body rod protein FlgG
MSDGLTISEISMINDLKRLQAISHNLSNVNTFGYKQQIMKTQSFHSTMDVMNTERVNQEKIKQLSAQMPMVETVVDIRSGALKFTGKPLNVSLVDEVFLAVQSAQGEVYTRHGDLHIDAQGRLVTTSGHPVQGVSGDIRLTSDKPVISQQGQIFIDDQLVAELKLVKIGVNAKLESLGKGLYLSNQAELIDQKKDVIRQGYLEASNVNMNEQMIKMIETTRHFETSQKLIRGYDEMMGNAISEIANFEGL